MATFEEESTYYTPKIGQIWGCTPGLIFSTPSGEYGPATTPVAFFILELLGGVIAAFVFTIMHAQGYGSSISGTSKYDAEFVGTFVLVVTVGADPFRLADSRFAGQESLLPPIACVGNLLVVHTSRVGGRVSALFCAYVLYA